MYRQMQYFVAIVETGNFSEAAERCHISQSAISQQIKALEDELGVALLERRGRRFVILPAGRYFYQRARRQLAEMESLIREVRRIGRDEHQQLRIGVLTGFSGRIVHEAVNAFVRSHPYVQVSVTTGTHEEIFQQIISGQLELVINDQRRALSDQFINEELGEQPLYALIRQDMTEGAAFLEFDKLKDCMCLIVTPPAWQENETGFWRDVIGIKSDILFMDDMETALMNVTAGVGWLPCDRDTPCATGMALIPLMRGGAPLTRRMFAFWPESIDSSLQWEFAETLSESFS